jgi:hypothetical protein
MSDIVYDKAKKILIVGKDEWQAVSGIEKKYKPIAEGQYTAPKGALMAGQKGLGVPTHNQYNQQPFSYRDGKGLSWFLWLGKGNLGIHPDGNVPGTKGCIGVTAEDTRPLFNKLKQMNIRPLTVIVR